MDTTSDRDPVDILADEFAARLRNGESPSIDDYVKDHPEIADEIQAVFPSIEMMERISQKEHTERSFETRTGRLTGDSMESLGDFQIIREVGRGGMGVVYEALQKSLKRRVALKVLGPTVGGAPNQIQRFMREAESAARLHHTNIVPVYGVGEDEGLHYYAMQYIEGVTLSKVVRTLAKRFGVQTRVSDSRSRTVLSELVTRDSPDSLDSHPVSGTETFDFSSDEAADVLLTGTFHGEQTLAEGYGPGDVDATVFQSPSSDQERDASNRTTSEYWRSVARLTADVADALDYSHQHGVLHRDIKPSNLMLDREGVVWVTDFGLARHEDHDGVTNTGDIVGTLRYMAPEQFNGETDSRSDICSLGLTMYELLALRPAFEESKHGPLIAQKTSTAPTRLRSLNPDIPRDLETVTLKACATNPADRYATAGELADDLRRFLEDRPVRARRVTSIERLWRWARRNPVVAGLSSATMILLATVAVVFAVGQHRTEKVLRIVEAQKGQVDELLEAEQLASALARTESERAEQNLSLAVEAFDSIIENISSRGVPRSIQVDFEDAVLADEQFRQETVLTAADVDLLETLLKFFDAFAGQNSTDLRVETAIARKRVGDIQRRLGRFKEAEDTYRLALSAFETLSEQQTGNILFLIERARIRNEIGVSASQRGSMRGAFDQHFRAKRILEESEQVLESRDGRFELARTVGLVATIGDRSGVNTLMNLMRNAGQPPGGGAPARPSSRDSERRPGPPSGSGRGDRRPGEGHRRPSQRGPFRSWSEAVVGASDQSLELLNGLLEDEPSNVEYRLALARAWRSRVNVGRATRDAELARQALGTAIQHFDELARDFPEQPLYRFELADTLCLRTPRPPEGATPETIQPENDAEARARRAVNLCEDLIETYANVAEYQALMGSALNRLATILRSQDRNEEAMDCFENSIVWQLPLADRYPTASLYQIAYLQSLKGLSEIHIDAGDDVQGMEYLDQAIGRLEQLTEEESGSRFLDRYLSQLKRLREGRTDKSPGSARSDPDVNKSEPDVKKSSES